MRSYYAANTVLSLALAGCSAGESDEAGDKGIELAVSTTEASSNKTSATAPTETDEEADGRSSVGLILASLRGAWHTIGSSCSPESDSRIEITATKIIFHESVGTVTAIEEHAQGLIVTLEMKGEGETWTRRDMLRLSEQDPHGEILLVLPPPEQDILVTPARWVRCSA